LTWIIFADQASFYLIKISCKRYR